MRAAEHLSTHNEERQFIASSPIQRLGDTLRERVRGIFASHEPQTVTDEPIKGMIPRVEPTQVAIVAEKIIENKPDSPKKQRAVGMLADFVVDSEVLPKGPEGTVMVEVLRAVVHEDMPSVKQVAEILQTTQEAVEGCIEVVPYLKLERREDGKEGLVIPEVETNLDKWEENVIQALPEDVDRKVVRRVLRPRPKPVTVYNQGK